KITPLAQHIGEPAGHARREIAAGGAQHDDDAAGHIFAAVIADALDDRYRTGVAHGETRAGHAAEIAFAGDGAVKHGVADDDRLMRRDFLGVARGIDDDLAAREALADIIVRL